MLIVSSANERVVNIVETNRKKIETNTCKCDFIFVGPCAAASFRVCALVFTGQFKSAQEYVERSLEEALNWMDRHPSKEIKGYIHL